MSRIDQHRAQRTRGTGTKKARKGHASGTVFSAIERSTSDHARTCTASEVLFLHASRPSHRDLHGTSRDLYFMNFLLRPLPNPRKYNHFRALRAVSEMRASRSCPSRPFVAAVLRNEPNLPASPTGRASVPRAPWLCSQRHCGTNAPLPLLILGASAVPAAARNYQTNPTRAARGP